MCRKDRESWLFGEIGLLVFCVSVSQTAQAAEQVTDRDDTREPGIANRLPRGMVVDNGLGQFRRQVPVSRDDLAALAMSNPERFLFGFMQGNPFRAATFE